MARVNIPITQIPTEGVVPPAQVTGNPAENHYLASNAGNVFIEAVNSNASATATVTIIATGEVDGLPVEDVIATVPKSGTELIAVPVPQAVNQPNGEVYVSVSSAEVKFRAYSL
jgi:hypothetical protein